MWSNETSSGPAIGHPLHGDVVLPPTILAGLADVPFDLAIAVRALHRGDLDLQPAAGTAVAGVVPPVVAVREAVDVIAARVLGGLHDLAVHLSPAPQVGRVHHEEGDAAGLLHPLQPDPGLVAVEPDVAVAVLVPDRGHLRGVVLVEGGQDRRELL